MILNKVVKTSLYIIILLLIVLSPIFIGSVEPFSKMVLRLEIVCIFIIWLINSSISGKNTEITKPGLSFMLLLAFLGLCVLQIIPLPVPLIELVSPETGRIWNTNGEIIKQFSPDYSPYFSTLSIVPHYSLNMTLGIVCYVLLGYVISRSLYSKKGLSILVYTFAAVLVVESLVGSYQFLTGNSAFSEVKKRIATGTFVNKNHFAGFLELSIPIIASFLLYHIHTFDNKLRISRKLLKSFQTGIFTFVTGFALVIFIFSFSRMGYVSFLLSLLVTFVLYVKITGKFSRKMLIPLIFILIFVLFGVTKSFTTLSESISRTDKDIGGRITIYSDTLNAIKDFPLFGTGLGTFRAVYPGYKTLEQANTVNYAHNDYLQIALETGLFGFSLLIAALILFLRKAVRKLYSLHEDKNYFYFYIKLGALCSIFSILIHSICDFNLHIPSNAAYFSILVGIIACRENEARRAKPKRDKTGAIPLSRANGKTVSGNN